MKFKIFFFLLMHSLLSNGQVSCLGAGGGGTGPGGTISFSVGQLVYKTHENNHYLQEGVQQASEVTNLPIELLYFRAEVEEQEKVLLSWKTLSEYNNDFFTIERSHHGIIWEKLFDIQGAGTTSEPKEYQRRDENPYNGFSYYRLKQTDYDKQSSFSDWRVVEISRPVRMSIYPNPTTSEVFLEIPNYPVSFQIYDIYGKLIIEGVHQDEKSQLDISDLASGQYLIKIYTSETKIDTYQLIKQ